MKCLVNWIPLRIHVRSRNTQPHLNCEETTPHTHTHTHVNTHTPDSRDVAAHAVALVLEVCRLRPFPTLSCVSCVMCLYAYSARSQDCVASHAPRQMCHKCHMSCITCATPTVAPATGHMEGGARNVPHGMWQVPCVTPDVRRATLNVAHAKYHKHVCNEMPVDNNAQDGLCADVSCRT